MVKTDLSMLEDLYSYEIHVGRLAQAEDGTVFMNSGPEHAALVIRELLSKAKKQVNIVSGNLSDRVFAKELFSQLRSKNVEPESVRIVLTDSDGKNATIPQWLEGEGMGKIEVLPDGSPYHFATVDGRHFRWESDVDRMAATFGFGCAEQVDGMNKLFEIIWERAVSYGRNTSTTKDTSSKSTTVPAL